MKSTVFWILLFTSFAAIADSPVDISGRWNFIYPDGALILQDGSSVIGKSGGKHPTVFYRGEWKNGTLFLVQTTIRSKNCGGPSYWILKSDGTVNKLVGKHILDSGKIFKKEVLRKSPRVPEKFEYPYGDELSKCETLTTQDLDFDFDKAILKNPGTPILKNLAKVLTENPGIKIALIGHTDSSGTTERNQKLSLERANAVKQILAGTYSVAPERIRTDGKGASQPIAKNDSEEGKMVNRRVEIILDI